MRIGESVGRFLRLATFIESRFSGRTVRVAQVCLVALTVGCLASCDTEQPSVAGDQTITLGFKSTIQQDVILLRVYEGFVDQNNDNVSDDGETFLFCRTSSIAQLAESIPWPFSIRVSVVRAGSTDLEVLTPPSAASTLISWSRADAAVAGGSVVNQPDIMAGGVNYSFRTGQLFSPFNATILAATTNPISTAEPMTYGYGNGLCSVINPPVASIAGLPTPAMFDLQLGETVQVEGRIGGNPYPTGGPLPTSAFPALSAEVTIDGVAIPPRAEFVTEASEGAAFRFSFSSQ